MNGRILVSKPLYVALAQRKEERKAQLAAQHMQRVSGLRMHQVQILPLCLKMRPSVAVMCPHNRLNNNNNLIIITPCFIYVCTFYFYFYLLLLLFMIIIIITSYHYFISV